ncbi:ThuA domain-containing protein [Jiulongibacter sp. NS-SX5]|uniref:ThuA domain-containing protein n=1 Tax=Jiulongibacter sp. NS-SX5 TaxID=3463854 RepID=UPI0040583414
MSRRRKKKRKLWIKRILLGLAAIAILIVASFSVFMYKVKNGFPFFEEERPNLELTTDQTNILLFSKANAFVHSEGIEAAKPTFRALAEKNNWTLTEFDEGGVFNPEQLALFDLVIWNNVSGKVLTNEQRTAFQRYILDGGSFMGIHAAGDGSHNWDWYTTNLIGAQFSHHPIKDHIQEAELFAQPLTDSLMIQGIPSSIKTSDEWYIFNNQPTENGFTVLYQMDGNSINPDGNILFERSKNFGMGEKHPNMWFKKVGKGKSFYSALGHHAQTYQNEDYITVLEKALQWLVK